MIFCQQTLKSELELVCFPACEQAESTQPSHNMQVKEYVSVLSNAPPSNGVQLVNQRRSQRVSCHLLLATRDKTQTKE